MKNIVIVLNGCPMSGKDFIGNKLSKMFTPSPVMVKFRTHVDELLCERLGISEEELMEWDKRENKDTLRPDKLLGMTLREARIHQSEVLTKPVLGKDYFGRVVAERIETYHKTHGAAIYIITDGGFYDEVKHLFNDNTDVYLYTLSRNGTDWKGDSRIPLWNKFDGGSLLANNRPYDDVIKDILDDVNNKRVTKMFKKTMYDNVQVMFTADIRDRE